MRSKLTLIALAIALALLGGALPAAAGEVVCVGSGPGCHATIQAALDAAANGDTIRIAPGTFAGGVTITKSVRVVGAGPGRTVIRGGGPVVTIGQELASSEPTVTISGLTVTGGRTSGDGVEARGGGILVPPAAGDTTGATVTLRDVVVTGNRAEPTETDPSPSGAPCPTGSCPYAKAAGGGIFSAGTLSLDRVVVSHNRAGGIASDALGGGVFSDFGTLTLDRTLVVGNAAIAAKPNGRFAEGGGLFVDSGSLTIHRSVISANRAELTSSLPIFAADGETVIDMNAHGGGVHVSGGGVATRIDHTAITHNTVRVTDPVGEPVAFDAAMLVDSDSPLTMRDSVISHNTVTATVATTAHVGPSGTALEVDGPTRITNTQITDNPVTVPSPNGVAGALSGVAVYNFSDHPPALVRIEDSAISNNTASASSPGGSAVVQGAGVLNNARLELRRRRGARELRPREGARCHRPGRRDLERGAALRTAGRADPAPHPGGRELPVGRPRREHPGAGLYTTFPVTLVDSLIARNRPDQCFGCSSPTVSTRTLGQAGLSRSARASAPKPMP